MLASFVTISVICHRTRLSYSVIKMYYYFVFVSLLPIFVSSSVKGQTLNESLVHVSSKSDQNSTVDIFDQQDNGALVTAQEKENIDLAKKILYPCLLVFGTFGNGVTVIIHKRSPLTSPLSVFFITLAVADTLLLYSNCFTAWLYITFHYSTSRLSSVVCKIHTFLIYVSGVLSAWTLVAMTAQRAVCVLFPHRANVLCSVRRSKVIVVSMALVIAAVHVHILYGLYLETNNGSRTCTLMDEYKAFFREIWSWVDMCIFSLLPWLCLAVSNSLLVWKLKTALREAEVSLGSGQTDRIKDRKKTATSITITLIAVSTAFLVLTFPWSFLSILHFVYWMNGSLNALQSSRAYFYTKQISFPLWYANSCINFYVYCLTGSKFRKEAKQILCCVFH